MKTVLFGFVALALLSAPAVAEPIVDAPIVVRYVDLDISREDDAGILLSRLDRAAERFCEEPLMSQARHARTAVRACRNLAVSKAVARVNAPMLTEVYARSRGRVVRTITASN